MKTSEFIKQFNELGTLYDNTSFTVSATKEKAFAHSVVINVFKNNKFQITAARLPEGFSGWDFYGGAPFSPEMLELMAELAKTPPEERDDAQRYVILNGLPHRGTCSYFLIDAYSGRLLPSHLDGLDESNVAAMGTYSREGLREAKRGLTPELAAAVDLMTVTLERAIELTEQSKHDDLD